MKNNQANALSIQKDTIEEIKQMRKEQGEKLNIQNALIEEIKQLRQDQGVTLSIIQDLLKKVLAGLEKGKISEQEKNNANGENQQQNK